MLNESAHVRSMVPDTIKHMSIDLVDSGSHVYLPATTGRNDAKVVVPVYPEGQFYQRTGRFSVAK